MSAILDRRLWLSVRSVLDAPLIGRATLSVGLAAIASAMAAIAPMFLAHLIDAISRKEAAGQALASGVFYVGMLSMTRLIGHVQTYQYMASDQALQRRVSEVTFDRLVRLPLSYHLDTKAGSVLEIHQNALQGARTFLSLACATLLPIAVQMLVILCVVSALFDGVIWLVVSATMIAYACLFETGLAAVIIFLFSLSCLVILALERVQSGALSAGGFLLLTTYMLQIVGPMEMTGYAVRDLGQGAAYMSEWKELLAKPTEYHSAPSVRRKDPARGPPSILFEDVSFSYLSGSKTLSNVSFEVPSGETVAIVGATGAGKTSILRLLQRHVSADSGRVTLDGASISDVDVRDLRQRIAVVAQHVVLFNDTLRYNLALAKPDANDVELAAALAIARLDGFVAKQSDGLNTVVGTQGLKLSGGERQRLAIARAVLRGGDILLLDEATSSLDAKTEHEIIADIAAMAKGRTTLIVTHRLALAAKAATIVVLQDGRVVETGIHSELVVGSGPYAALWSTQMHQVQPSRATVPAGD
ncbi:MAG: ATP-binding cassette domain-containing protein [Burkholderiales bacterium]|nr:MAG: ATP-binding cassette domain-containing protein [Burkholderiales bacterium]